MSPQVLHVDFLGLAASVGGQARQEVIDAAGALTGLDEVLSVALIEGRAAGAPTPERRHGGGPGSDFDLALLFLLPDFAALEPFGTHPSYSRFLQSAVAPVLESLAGADVRLESDFPAVEAFGVCASLAAAEETYDWEVQAALAAWAADIDATARVVGLALGDRGPYRGLAAAFSPKPLTVERPLDGRFTWALVGGRARILA